MAAGSPRKSADERRVEVVRAALGAFARGGYAGTSTAEIAQLVGVSQPYLFRLFSTKRELFLAVADHCFTRIRDVLARAAEGLSGERAENAMAVAYHDLLDDRDLLLFQLQLYAAGGDEEIAAATRRHWDRLWSFLAAVSGAEPADLVGFLGHGMLLNVLTAMGLPRDHPTWSCMDQIRDRLA